MSIRSNLIGIKQSRYTPWRHLGERRYSSYSFSTSALGGGEWSRPGRDFTPRERTPGTHWTGVWVGPRAVPDTEARGKILCPRRESNPDRPVVQPVVRHYTDWANPAPNIIRVTSFIIDYHSKYLTETATIILFCFIIRKNLALRSRSSSK
jgi:hypothetical protein